MIDLHGKNILVSAAAGSGKTAVLVERIVKMVSEGEHPADIDRLLVVTFTTMAAGELRERIALAIGRRLEAEPENSHLERQMTLIHNAQITTIDSFCLFILRNHFHLIGLDPGFRVADEGELKLLIKDVLAELLEDKYLEGSPEFQECVEYFTTGSGDRQLEDYITQLYSFSMAFPWPEDWLKERKADYMADGAEDSPEQGEEKNSGKEQEQGEEYKEGKLWSQYDQSDWGLFLRGFLRELSDGCAEELDKAVRICEEPDGPYMYAEMLNQELDMVLGLKKAVSLEEYAVLWEKMTFSKLPSKKDATVSAAKRELVQGIRNRVKKALNETGEQFFRLSPAQAAVQMGRIQGSAATLLDLALDFKQRLDAAKREKNIIDFSDMEHFALMILLEKTAHGTVPTAAARELREYFTEILIDEYQDSNMVQELLLESISGEAGGRFNRFMVGDVKQSIYRFRLARPELFMEKYDHYPLETDEDGQTGETCRRIDLSQNFRSRTEVLDSVNHVFAKIMRKSIGGVEYDRRAALNPGAGYPVQSGAATEMMLFDPASEGTEDYFEDESPKEMEARMIARRIKELKAGFQVTDKETGKLRPVSFRDIVILLRTNEGWDEVFRKILEEEGIPSHTTSRTGYFETTEIRTVLQVIRVLDNPLQDIPLFGVLKSYFGGFNDEEIAEIKAGCRDNSSLYQKLLKYRDMMAEVDENTVNKIDKFLAWTEEFRRKAVYIPIQNLLKELIIDSGYYHVITVSPAGGQRIANLEMLMAKAESFSRTSYYGLFHFVRYIEQLEKYDVDYGEVNIMDEQDDIVRLMSIHKSKGLEFPVCFVAGLAKKFNMQDSRSGLIIDADLGIGVDYVDPGLRVQGRSLRKNVVSRKMKMDSLGEELRVLYVAMTRAKEKLILSGTAKVPVKDGAGRPTGRLSFLELTGAGSYLDFLLPVIMDEGAKTYFNVRVWTREQMYYEEIKESTQRQIRQKELLTAAFRDEIHLNKNKMTVVSERLARQYSRKDLDGLYTKTTVSELKKTEQNGYNLDAFAVRLFEEPEIVPYIPMFRKGKEEMTGTVRGSAYHKVMELLCFQDISVQQQLWQVEQQMKQAYEEGRLSEEYHEAVRYAKIVDFLETSLAQRMIIADRKGKLYKEQPFVIGLSARRLDQVFSPQETILIQGIIDVYFEEDGQLVVIDYKTDAVEEAEELIRCYRKQLEYYGEALEQLTGKKVKEKVIYSFALHKEVRL